MTKLIFTLFLVILFFSVSLASRILVFFPGVTKSHSILAHAMVDRLLEDGHEIVHITPYPKRKKVANLKEMDVSAAFTKIIDKDLEDKYKLKYMVEKKNFGISTSFFMSIVQKLHMSFFRLDNFIDLLSDPEEKFDAVILEWFYSETTAGISALFQCPLIWVCSTEAHWQALRVIDEVSNPSYNVDLMSTNIPPLTMYQRLQELWYIEMKQIMYKLWIIPKEWFFYHSVYPKIAEKRGVIMPGYEEAVYNGSFMFINSHPSYGSAIRLPQNAKYIGGYHIDDEIAPLPENLQKIMDDTEHGVIYFSLGTMLNSSDMSEHMKDSLFETFGKLKETVLWKFEEERQDVPKNIVLVKWAPQQSILAHPNLKLFITHGGKLSTTEAIHFAVPIIGIPIVIDQFVNMKSIVQKGFGIALDMNNDIATNLVVALEEILRNNTYKERVREISMIYHDRITSPSDELRHWVRQVVRTRGALHLRSHALPLTTYTKVYLDVVGIIALVSMLCYYLVKRFVMKSNNYGKIKQH